MTRRWERWLTAGILIFALAVLTTAVSGLLRPRGHSPEPVPFSAQWTGDRIQVDFDSSNRAVANASSGLLRVRDGNRMFEYNVERKTLSSGGFDYRPASSDVQLTLVLLGGSGDQRQLTVRAVGVEPASAAPDAGEIRTRDR